MIWQDYLITVAQIILWLATIPMIRAKNKPPVLTSSSAAVGLYAITVALFSLGLWASVIITVISGSSWIVLMIQRIRQKKNMVRLV